MTTVTPSIAPSKRSATSRVPSKRRSARPESVKPVFRPQNWTPVDLEKGATPDESCIDALDDDDDVQNVYANYEMSDEDLARLEGDRTERLACFRITVWNGYMRPVGHVAQLGTKARSAKNVIAPARPGVVVMHAPGLWGIIVIAVVVVLLFGRGKISGLMGEVASGIKSFQKGMREDDAKPAGKIDASASAEPKPRDGESRGRLNAG